MNKLCRTYIRKVKLLFPVMGKYERKYIKAITINVNDYLADVPESTIDDLYKEFGTPKDIIDSYYSTVNFINYMPIILDNYENLYPVWRS